MITYLKNNISKSIALFCIVIASLWIYIGPRLLVSPSSSISFLHTGEIGDTIGGITAPVIGLVSAILVYLSFTAQIKANRVVQEEANFKYIVDEFEKSKAKFDSFIYVSIIGKKEGLEAMDRLTTDILAYIQVPAFTWNLDQYLSKANFQILHFALFLNEVEELQISRAQRKTIQSKIWLFYNEYLNQATLAASLWNLNNTTLPAQTIIGWEEFRFRMLELRNTMERFQQAFEN